MNAADSGFLLPPGLETVPLDMAVLTVLAAEFGWVSCYAITKRLSPDLQDEKSVAAALERLVATGRVLVRERYSNVSLFRLPPAPGEEATAAPLPAPPAKVIRYVGPEDEAIPAPRLRRRRSAPQPRLSPAKAPLTTMEEAMRINKEQVFQQLSHGKQTTAEVAKALKCSTGAAGFHLNALQADKKVHKPDGRMGPWALLNAAAAPTSAPAARGAPRTRATKPNKQGVADLDLKLLVLENHICASQDAGRTITAHVLREIRADLERQAA